MPNGVNRGEAWIDLPTGERLVFQNFASSPSGVDYVRFVDKKGVELLYYHYNEWREDPRCTMGAILGAMIIGAYPFSKK